MLANKHKVQYYTARHPRRRIATKTAETNMSDNTSTCNRIPPRTNNCLQLTCIKDRKANSNRCQSQFYTASTLRNSVAQLCRWSCHSRVVDGREDVDLLRVVLRRARRRIVDPGIQIQTANTWHVNIQHVKSIRTWYKHHNSSWILETFDYYSVLQWWFRSRHGRPEPR